MKPYVDIVDHINQIIGRHHGFAADLIHAEKLKGADADKVFLNSWFEGLKAARALIDAEIEELRPFLEN